MCLLFSLHDVVQYSGSYEVHDVENNAWFKIEGKDVESSLCKKLTLNTGIHHATMERADTVWHISVASDRRVTIEKDTSTRQYHVFIYSHPYPPKDSIVDLDSLNPSLKIIGNPRDYDYWCSDIFQIVCLSFTSIRYFCCAHLLGTSISLFAAVFSHSHFVSAP